VVTVTMNRPEKKNAINPAMWRELLDTFADVAERQEDRVVVLTGAGGAFCSGADLSPRGATNFSTADTAGAIAAFIAKREPRFSGR
jgi:1,4-dihydroxy-2-naphthoyl-CoA synthase